MRHVVTIAAAFAVMSTQAAAADNASATCMTEPEANALFIYAIPEALTGVAKSCKAVLPATAFLPTKSDETIGRFRAAANGSWPMAKAAFLKIVGPGDDSKVISGMSDSALEPFVAATLAGTVSKDIKPADCGKIDRFVAALAPIPVANAAQLLTALMGLVGKGNDGFRIC